MNDAPRIAKIAVWPLLALGLGTIGLVTACDSEATEEFNDAPRLGNLDTPALRISMPNGFGNLAAKCVGTDLVYSAANANGRAVAVSPSHPWCDDSVLTERDLDR